MLGGRGPAQLAVAGDDLDRPDPVGGQPVGAGHRAEAAAGGVPDDADVGDRAGQRGQAVRRGRLDDPQPLDAGADPGPALRVHDALVQPGGVDQQLTDERGDGAVAGGLRGDDQAVAAGEPHRLHDVLRGPRGDARRPGRTSIARFHGVTRAA